MKVGKKARRGRHKRSPKPHNNNKRNYRASPFTKHKRVKRRRLRVKLREADLDDSV